jgi:PhoPQ-activated pathogenicity-related protein
VRHDFIVRRLCPSILAASALLAPPIVWSQPDAATATVLADYVARPDASYSWEVRARYRSHGAEVVLLHLRSQTWRDTLWKHQLLLVRPRHIATPEQGLLVIGGGRWRDEYDTGPAAAEIEEDAEIFVRIASRLDTVVAVLGQVPFQPLFGMTEDRLIAHSFDQYLQSGDPEWPLLLPMVKSAVRAMDATVAAAGDEWQMSIERFTVLGGSKRGWTTWLTAAVEPRVSALVPAVIDALNMARHFPYQTAVWGAPSAEIAPYTELNLHEALAADAGSGASLRAIVDPYSYRQSITQPKLVVLATNDAYFPLDSANLYWDDLVGTKHLLYLPNDEHSIEDYGRLVATLRALHTANATGTELPRLDWEFVWREDGALLCVAGEVAPRAIDIWQAISSDLDFRDATWTSSPARGTDDRYLIDVAAPAEGYAAVFAEARFGRGRRAFTVSTNVAVLAAPGLPAPGPKPRGVDGVCPGWQ